MFYLGENLTLEDVFHLCRKKYIPEGCVILEIRATGEIEHWPANDSGITKGSTFEEDDLLPPEELHDD